MEEETSRLFKKRAYLIIRWFSLWFYATQLKCTLSNLHLVLYTLKFLISSGPTSSRDNSI